MNTKSLGTNFLILGVVLLGVAVYWWATFYGPIVHHVGSSMTRVSSCLYSQGGICGVTRGVAELVGQSNPYHPIVCWAGAVFTLLGAVLRISR
jgi:hypothetical protein